MQFDLIIKNGVITTLAADIHADLGAKIIDAE
jgi:hypothetical protein